MTPSRFIACGILVLLLGIGMAGWHRGIPARHPSISATSASVMRSASHEKSADHAALLQRLKNGEYPRPTAAQLQAYVDKKGHSAGSLLTAWRMGNDNAWLDEAASKYPDDPRVALSKLEALRSKPQEAKEWIERLQKNAPENSLGWCYAAQFAAKEGRMDEAKEALAEAVQRHHLDSYSKEFAQDGIDLWRSAGYDGLESEILGQAMIPIPDVAVTMDLLGAFVIFADQHDTDAYGDMLNLAQMIRGDGKTPYVVSQLVSITTEKRVLERMDVLDFVPDTDVSVAERLVELDDEKITVREAVKSVDNLLPSLNDSELRQYMRRRSVEGELKAMQWLVQLKQTR